ncbi:MAG: MBL fold metallo-hydrolase [Chloroflexota bacterium]|nr:MBL fold metallo-hydrolase [Chloroflexota bacterium]
MRLTFLGATGTVTGSQFLVETAQARVLVDCGMFQGSPHEIERNRQPLTYDPRLIDAILLTHAHLDHCGLIPLVVAEGFGGPIFCTNATAELAELVLVDSGKLQEEFAERDRRPWGRRRNAPRGAPDAAANEVTTRIKTPLYDEQQAHTAVRQFRAVRYGAETEVARGIRATFLDAGHILGSAIIRIDADGQSVVFSGDLGRPDTPIIRDPTPVSDADYVVVEGTYGGREHEPQEEASRALAEAVRLAAEATGVLLIPAFAIGRTQEIVWELNALLDRHEIPRVPLYLDSPMASKASAIYHRYPDHYDEETTAALKRREDPLDYPGAKTTRDSRESRAIAKAKRPYIVVASNGMLTGGRVLHHLKELIDDERAVLLFVGYQGHGTLGAALQGGVAEAVIDGRRYPVRCKVRSVSGFSAHADESELLDWLRGFTRGAKKPKRVFVVHADPPARDVMVAKIRELGLESHAPEWRETVALD